MLEGVFWNHGDPGLLMAGKYQTSLVALSVLIAILTCCMGMQIAGIARQSQNTTFRHLAVATGSLALGAGIWSMHFIGMLAFKLGIPVSYDPLITFISVLPAVLASWIALEMLARNSVSPRQLLTSGVLMGAGIGIMHYTGMAAMRMDALLRYDPFWFAVSILVSVFMAWFALWLRFGLHQNRILLGNPGVILLSGSTMGMAVASMHYVAMEAARFIGHDTPGREHSFNMNLVVGISTVTVLLGGLVLAGNLFLRFRVLYQQLQLSEARQKAIFSTAVDGIITIDRDSIMRSVNPSVTRLFGWESHELIGQNVKMLMPTPHRAMHHQYLENYLNGQPAKVIGIGRETMGQRKDGSTFPIRLAVGEIRVEEITKFVGFITDISEQKRIEQLLEREATHDALTNLANRRLLTLALPRFMTRTERSGLPFALLFIDLDGFKQVNDELGHDIGDELLKEVAQCLNQRVRSTDLVARLAGDEFVILLEDLHNEAEAQQVAEQIRQSISCPMMLNGHQVTVGASIGITFYHKGCNLTGEALLQKADRAMYRVKKNGKGSIALL